MQAKVSNSSSTWFSSAEKIFFRKIMVENKRINSFYVLEDTAGDQVCLLGDRPPKKSI